MRDVIIGSADLNFSCQAPLYMHITQPIIIGEGVRVGARAIGLVGVTIGKYAIVAVCTVFTRASNR